MTLPCRINEPSGSADRRMMAPIGRYTQMMPRMIGVTRSIAHPWEGSSPPALAEDIV